MKTTQLKTFALTAIFLAQPVFSAHAYIVKNPVDLSPTALRNSGATYGPNVVTHVMGSNEDKLSTGTTADANNPVSEDELITFDEMPGHVSARDAVITDPVTDNDDVPAVDTVRSSAVLENPNHRSNRSICATTATTNGAETRNSH
jgi:hypothetical protein